MYSVPGLQIEMNEPTGNQAPDQKASPDTDEEKKGLKIPKAFNRLLVWNSPSIF